MLLRSPKLQKVVLKNLLTISLNNFLKPPLMSPDETTLILKHQPSQCPPRTVLIPKTLRFCMALNQCLGIAHRVRRRRHVQRTCR